MVEARELNPLESYVLSEDDSYQLKMLRHGDGSNFFVNQYELTSQRWLTDKEVDRPLWKHSLSVIVPHNANSDIALLFIAGGSNHEQGWDGYTEGLTDIARTTNAVVAELRMIPNQPLTFHDDGQPRSEDDMIAYAWRHLLDTGDMRWIPRGPMVKASIRAMDAISAMKLLPDDGNIKRFVVAGGSKRGHTTWLTGAMDERVVAIVPIVIDVLNMRESMQHHFASLGFWAAAIGNYVEHGIMHRMSDPKTAELLAIVDPLSYVDRLRMPKLVINATGDQYFLPDSSQFYWNRLQGEKYLRYVPNGEHSLQGTDALESLTAFLMLQVAGKKPPTMSWHLDADGVLLVETDLPPDEARVWSMTNPIARDFRVETFGRNYKSEVLVPEEDGRFRSELVSPSQGWTASMVEFTWDLGLPVPFKQTTSVYVLPETLPFEGKKNHLPTSITVVCEASDETKRKEVTSKLKAVDSWPFTDKELMIESRDKRLYVNWIPQGRYDRGLALIDYLKKNECEPLTYHHESGRSITYSPNLPSNP